MKVVWTSKRWWCSVRCPFWGTVRPRVFSPCVFFLAFRWDMIKLWVHFEGPDTSVFDFFCGCKELDMIRLGSADGMCQNLSKPIYSVHEQIFWPTNLWKNMHASNSDAIPWNLAPIRWDDVSSMKRTDRLHLPSCRHKRNGYFPNHPNYHARYNLLFVPRNFHYKMLRLRVSIKLFFVCTRWLFTYSTMGFITIFYIWVIFQFFPTNNPTTIFYPWLGNPIINQLGCNGIRNRNRLNSLDPKSP